jgi:hypothetical protein
LACSAAVLVWAPAAAGNVVCDGVLSGTVAGNVVVPTGADCELAARSLKGAVRLTKRA